jgi:hypothetical protein
MSRTLKGGKGPGYEYWKSRLHRWGERPGRYTKVRTHRKERRRTREVEDEEYELWYYAIDVYDNEEERI